MEGSQLGIGTSENKIISVIITDENGEDVTDNYVITTKDCTLTITGLGITGDVVIVGLPQV